MLKTLAISILLLALLAVVGLFIFAWVVDWRFGAAFTGIIAFSAAMQWSIDYLNEHTS